VQALVLMGTYIVTLIVVQFVGFLISRLVDLQYPSVSVMVFLLLFIGAFGIAWPIAVRVAEFMIRRSGRTVQTADARAT